MTVDYPVTRTIQIGSVDELCELFRDQPHHARRLVGGGSSQALLPAPDES